MTPTPDLKAAALAASLMFDFVIDPPTDTTRCIRWVNAGCRPAEETEIAMWDALLERLQVAEDAAKDAPEDRDIDAYLDDLGIPEISDVPLEYDRSIWRACEHYHGIAARRQTP